MYQNHTGITITDVDREKNTVHLIVNGSIVEAVFSSEANPEVFDNIKQILINSMFQKVGLNFGNLTYFVKYEIILVGKYPYEP